MYIHLCTILNVVAAHDANKKAEFSQMLLEKRRYTKLTVAGTRLCPSVNCEPVRTKYTSQWLTALWRSNLRLGTRCITTSISGERENIRSWKNLLVISAISTCEVSAVANDIKRVKFVKTIKGAC